MEPMSSLNFQPLTNVVMTLSPISTHIHATSITFRKPHVVTLFISNSIQVFDIITIFLFCLVCYNKNFQAISKTLHETHERATAYSTLLQSYSVVNISVTLTDQNDKLEILHKISEQTKRILAGRESKLRRKAKSIESEILSQKNVDYSVKYNDSDFRRKGLQGFRVTKNLPFPYLSHPSSDVFIPVVKVMDNKTRKDISWTRKLIDFSSPPVFSYFIGTVNGLLRFYPGTEWPKEFDMYDCRLESWFLGAATSPHDIAILIDRSGSVTGITLRAIKKMARLVINTIPESYRINVFLFNNETIPLKPCFQTDPLYATDVVKTAFLSLLDKIEPKGPGLLNKALTDLEATYFNKTNSITCPRRILILFTDGRITFNSETIKLTLQRMNVKLIVLDFSSPLAFGPNRQLQKVSCKVNGHYVFVKTFSDWFRVGEILFDAVSSKTVRNVSSVSPSWSDAVLSFHKERGIIISLPLYNKTRSGYYKLHGVLGTELLLKDLQSNLRFEAGTLSYEVIALSTGRVISHPRILKSSKVLSLSHITVEEGSYIIYPLANNKPPIVAKVSSVFRLAENGVQFQLIIPQNDAFEVSISPLDKEITRASEISKSSGNTLLVRSSALHPFRFNNTEKQHVLRFNYCDSAYKTLILKRCCPGYKIHILPLLRDIIVTDVAVKKWTNRSGYNNSTNSILGNFLITSRGVLRTTLLTHRDPLPRKVPEWVEFAADPDKFPSSTLIITDYTSAAGGVVLSKSVDRSFNGTKKVILSVTGTSVKSDKFFKMILELFKMYGLGSDNYVNYLLDHRGYIFLSTNPESFKFFGEINGPLFLLLTNEGYYSKRTFIDCMSDCDKVVRSNAMSRSLFLTDAFKTMVSVTLSVLTQITMLCIDGIGAFIAPDSHANKQCCKEISTFDRDFSVNMLTVTKYNKCSQSSATTCLEQVAVQPLPNTNLILVVVVPNTSCECDADTSKVNNDTASEKDVFCDEINPLASVVTEQTCFDDVYVKDVSKCDKP